MPYYHKYLKYKLKYLELKNFIGGDYSEESKKKFEDELIEFIVRELFKLKENYDILINEEGVKINGIKWEWNTLKKSVNQDTMRVLFNFRNNLVDQLINKIFAFYPKCHEAEVTCQSSASGSVGPEANVYSDYDLTVTGHFQVSKMIQIFNSIIQLVFNLTPFEAMDTNLYGYSYMIPYKENFEYKNIWTVDTLNKYYCIETSEDICLDQDKWVYRRLLSFIQTKNPLKHKDMVPISLIDDDQNKWFENNSLNNLNALTQSKKYLEKMNYFEDLMNKYPDTITQKYNPEEINNVKKSIIDALSFMNYYGDETYFSQGAFVHVVGTMFYYNKETAENKARILKKYYVIHSMIENLAYFIHAYDKNLDIFYAIKYYQRFIDAFYLLCIIKDDNKPLLENLVELSKLLRELKNKFRNASDEEIQKYMGSNESADKIKEDKKQELVNKVNVILENIGKNITENIPMNKYWLYSLLKIIDYVTSTHSDYTYISFNQTGEVFSVTIRK